MTDVLEFGVRTADWSHARERNLVRSSWLRSHAFSGMARLVGHRAYYKGHHELIDHLLDHATVRIACSLHDPHTIIGWACLEPERRVLHYVWVQEDFRRHGVARELVGEREYVAYTHRTDAIKEFTLPPKWHYTVYPLMRGVK